MNISKNKSNLIESANDIVIQQVAGAKLNHPTFSENVCGSLTSIYENYLKRYAILLIIIICTIAFLLYRYYKNKEIKQKRDKNINKPVSSEDIMTKRIYEILKQNKTGSSSLPKKS